MLVFSRPEQLQVLQTANDLLVDGTFEVFPDICY